MGRCSRGRLKGGEVALRLVRVGRRNDPMFRIIAIPRVRGYYKKPLEYLGQYKPGADKLGNKHVIWDLPRIKYWIAQGANPSSRVHYLLTMANVLPPRPMRGVGPTLRYVPETPKNRLLLEKLRQSACFRPFVTLKQKIDQAVEEGARELLANSAVSSA
eukprot:gnl/Hemi2/5779_TR1989_c0_g1_i1.p1 gnl/Hemi2/5779_TR1989_c0_g1~~gnl/Hemi2/5779_TR1989_c0_g1_i1.p1  ORF type:complete len:159 (+),score=26.82 gnl/Hemi2/5779_TR1989_c0_g1_i1:61-537(+)